MTQLPTTVMRLMFVPRMISPTMVSGVLRMMCAGTLAIGLVSCRDSGKETGKPAKEEARAVKVATASLRPMEKFLTVSGTLAAQEESTLSVKVPGRLEKVAVDLGSVVKRGDLIAQVERRDYELRMKQAKAAVAEARAAVGLSLEGNEENTSVESIATVKQARAVLEEASKNRERVQRLAREGISSKSEVDTVDTAHAVASTRYESAVEEARTRLAVLAQRRADLDVAQQQLIDTSILAPFDGAIQTRTASPGEHLQLGTPVVSLVRLDPLRLRLEVPERDSIFVNVSQKVRLTVEGSTNVFRGVVARVSPAITEQNRMLMVEADVPGQIGLRPGLFVRAQIVVKENETAVSVPANALIVFAGIEKVITVEEGKARERTVNTGRRAAGWVEIISGLKPKEIVVLDPGNLRTGQAVKTTESASVLSEAPREATGP
jgi:RND family efflux transporter MFP subunit